MKVFHFLISIINLISFVPSWFFFYKLWECYRYRRYLAGDVGWPVCCWCSSQRAHLSASPDRVDHSYTHTPLADSSHDHPDSRSGVGGSRRRRRQWLPGGRGLQWACLPTPSVSRKGERGSNVSVWETSGAYGGTTADACKWWTLHHLHGQSTASQWVYIFI